MGLWGALGAIGSLATGAGSLMGAFSGGGSGGLEDADRDLLRAMWGEQLAQQRMGTEWMQYVSPYLQETLGQLQPLIAQRLEQPGLPPELENQVWQLARQRLARGYGDLENQLGTLAASRGMLTSGPVGQSWLQNVGLAKAQGETGLATERSLANYNAMQQAIGEAQSLLGVMPTSGGAMPSMGLMYNQPSQPMDLAGFGSLFARGLGAWGTQPGMGGGGFSQYGNYYGSNTPQGVQDMGTWSQF